MGHGIPWINTPLHEYFDCSHTVGRRAVKVGVSDLFVMLRREVFCKIISPVVRSFVPK